MLCLHAINAMLEWWRGLSAHSFGVERYIGIDLISASLFVNCMVQKNVWFPAFKRIGKPFGFVYVVSLESPCRVRCGPSAGIYGESSPPANINFNSVDHGCPHEWTALANAGMIAGLQRLPDSKTSLT